jgi:hypothetical protein
MGKPARFSRVSQVVPLPLPSAKAGAQFDDNFFTISYKNVSPS